MASHSCSQNEGTTFEATTNSSPTNWKIQIAKNWSSTECVARVIEFISDDTVPKNLEEYNGFSTSIVAIRRVQGHLAELRTYRGFLKYPQVERAFNKIGNPKSGEGKDHSLLRMSAATFQRAMRYGEILHKLTTKFDDGILLYIPPSWSPEFMQQMSEHRFEMLEQFLRTSPQSHHLRYLFKSAKHIIRLFGGIKEPHPHQVASELRLVVYTLREGLYDIPQFPFLTETNIRVHLDINREEYQWSIPQETADQPDRLSMKKVQQPLNITITRDDIESLRPGNYVTKATMTLLMILMQANRRRTGPLTAFYLPEQFTVSLQTVKFHGRSLTDDTVYIPILIEDEDQENWMMLSIDWWEHHVHIYDPSARFQLRTDDKLWNTIMALVPLPHPEWPRSERCFTSVSSSSSQGLQPVKPERDCDSGILVLRHFQSLQQSEELKVASIDEYRHDYLLMLIDAIWDVMPMGKRDGDVLL